VSGWFAAAKMATEYAKEGVFDLWQWYAFLGIRENIHL